MRELTTTEQNLLTCVANLEEAQAEIRRHHDLIIRMRDLLAAWQSLHAILPQAFMLDRLNVETLELLNREVG